MPLALGRALSVGHQKKASIPGVTMTGDFPLIDCDCIGTRLMEARRFLFSQSAGLPEFVGLSVDDGD